MISKNTKMGGFKASHLLWIALAVLVVIAGKKLLSPGGLLHGFLAPFKKDKTVVDHEKDIAQSVKSVVIDEKKCTKTSIQIQETVNTQIQAMWDLGTNTQLLFDSLVGFTADDLKALYKAFGLKSYTMFWGSVTVFTATLPGWYQAELSGKDLEKMKQIWSKAGVW